MMKATFALMLCIAIVSIPGTARSTALFSENFNGYVTGSPLTNASSAWKPIADTSIANRVLVSGKSAFLDPARNEQVYRMAAFTGLKYYVAFKIKVTDLSGTGTDAYFAAFRNGLNNRGRIFIVPVTSTTYRVGVGNGTLSVPDPEGVYPTIYNTGETHKVVVCYDTTVLAAKVTRVWIDPVAETDVPAVADDGTGGIIPTSFLLRQTTASQTLYIDDLITGITFNDVNTEPAVPWETCTGYADGPLTTANAAWVHYGGGTSGNQVNVASGRIFLDQTRQEDVGRSLGGLSGPVYYTSFKINVSALSTSASDNFFAAFKDAGSNTRGRVFLTSSSLVSTNKFRIAVANAATAQPASTAVNTLQRDLTLGKDHTVVIRYDRSNTSAIKTTLWIDPMSETDNPVIATDNPTNGIVPTTLALRQQPNMGKLYVDDIRKGSQWSDVFDPEVAAFSPLTVSNNQRYLTSSAGLPFFYLSDTSWGLLQKLTKSQADTYLADRADREFTVVQATILPGTGPGAVNTSGNATNTDGQTVLLNNDPATPNGLYFEHVDYVVDKAAENGLMIALMPTWGSNVNPNGSEPPANFTTVNARAYGEFLGARYRKKAVIWILGGDRGSTSSGVRDIWNALADGIRSTDGEAHLMTFHPCTPQNSGAIVAGGDNGTSADWYHNETWLDFNTIQSGHSRNRPMATNQVTLIGRDYTKTPAKPALDGENGYENIDEGINNSGNVPDSSRLNDYDVRTKAYWSVFSGAMGYTYGGNGVFQCAITGSEAYYPNMTWLQALDIPGAGQMKYLRRLMESRPVANRIPDQSVISRLPASDPTKVYGNHNYNTVVATRASDGAYAMVYSTSGKQFEVDMTKIAGTTVTAYWYNPSTGASTLINTYPNTGTRLFIPPTCGPGSNPPVYNEANIPTVRVTGMDWVLVLDNAALAFGTPGT